MSKDKRKPALPARRIITLRASEWRKHVDRNQPSRTVLHIPSASGDSVSTQADSIPWYIWAGVICASPPRTIGGAWDVSWHRTIGRDTSWTPAHMAIYACGLLAGIIGMWFIVKCTFLRDPELLAGSVNVFGLRAPLGVSSDGRLGWSGHAHLRAFRQLVAQRLRSGRKDCQPAACPVNPRPPRHLAPAIMFLILAAMNRAAGDSEPELFAQTADGSSSMSAAYPLCGQMFFLCRSTPGT